MQCRPLLHPQGHTFEAQAHTETFPSWRAKTMLRSIDATCPFCRALLFSKWQQNLDPAYLSVPDRCLHPRQVRVQPSQSDEPGSSEADVTPYLHEVDCLGDSVLVLQQVPVAAQAQEHLLGVGHGQLQPLQALLAGLPCALRGRLPHDQLLLQVLSLGAAVMHSAVKSTHRGAFRMSWSVPAALLKAATPVGRGAPAGTVRGFKHLIYAALLVSANSLHFPGMWECIHMSVTPPLAQVATRLLCELGRCREQLVKHTVIEKVTKAECACCSSSTRTVA